MRFLPLLLLFGCFGCHALSIATRSEVAFTNPISGSVGVAPATQQAPVKAMTVDGGEPCKSGPKIALIDVDG